MKKIVSNVPLLEKDLAQSGQGIASHHQGRNKTGNGPLHSDFLCGNGSWEE